MRSGWSRVAAARSPFPSAFSLLAFMCVEAEISSPKLHDVLRYGAYLCIVTAAWTLGRALKKLESGM